ncbi:MAG TPA: DUF4249 domain-containing protein [Mucilaginibacter sp.]
MRRLTYISVLIISMMGCRKPYSPPAITGKGSYLVVEGVINSGTDSTVIKLSRTVNVSSKVTANPVTGAALAVESDQNAIYPLTETANGNYVSAGLNLDISRQYRLSIKTSDNKQYLSDLVPVNVTPPIDSIGYNIVTTADTGIQIYVNTHDANNNTRYYRWDYDEAWAFHAKYASNFISDGSAIFARTRAQYMFFCFTNDVSGVIVLGSSAKLQQNVIYQNPIIFIPSASEKLESKYSILLREYALTADAYSFWVNLKKNTEQLGSIFDAQPSQIKGNIHSTTNPQEPVIGYISACTVSSKRIFISNSQLPNWVPTYPYQCNLDTTGKGSGIYIHDLIVNPQTFFIIDGIPSAFNPSRYTFTESNACVDCTIRGTKTQPAFWR